MVQAHGRLRLRVAARRRDAVPIIGVVTALIVPVTPTPLDEAERPRLVQRVHGAIWAVGIVRRRARPAAPFEELAEPHIRRFLVLQLLKTAPQRNDAALS